MAPSVSFADDNHSGTTYYPSKHRNIVDHRKNLGASSSPRVLPCEFYNQFISALSKSRKPSPIRHLFPMELRPGMLSMLAGKPNPSTFPFTSLSLSVRSPNPSIDPREKDIEISGDDLAAGLQYGLTSGMPALNQWVKELVTEVHGRPRGDGWRVTLGPGSQDLLYKAFLALVDPGDTILVEAPTYAGILPIIDTLKCNIVEVATDSQGLISSNLATILASWPRNKPFPKLLYTVPYGSNPTGTTIPLSRRVEVLHLARQYNFLILEDDPYFHLYFGSMPRPPSYFSLERSDDGEIGRVLRFDSFSKVLAAGLRLGWSTGPEALLDAIDLHGACSNMQPASTSQVIVLSLMKLWGISGFLSHTEQLSEFYRQRRDVFERALQKHLTGLAEWTSPNAGMFFWIKLLLPSSADFQNVRGDEGDSSVLIRQKAIHRGVLALPGECSFFDERKTAFIRVSFSLLSDEETDQALGRLASILREEWEEGCDSD